MVASKGTSIITVKLADHVSQLLADRMKLTGQNLDDYVGNLIERELTRTSLDEKLAPFQQAIETSGISDEEFDALIEEAREERFQEMHGKPSKRS
jgi:hypothetical protein